MTDEYTILADKREAQKVSKSSDGATQDDNNDGHPSIPRLPRFSDKKVKASRFIYKLDKDDLEDAARFSRGYYDTQACMSSDAAKLEVVKVRQELLLRESKSKMNVVKNEIEANKMRTLRAKFL